MYISTSLQKWRLQACLLAILSIMAGTDGSAVETWVAFGANGRIPASLYGIGAIAGGGQHSLALKRDGTVVAWGWNSDGQALVPVGLAGVKAIACGYNYNLALKHDGTILAWGDNHSGQTNVPLGLTGVVAIAATTEHSLALKADGTVVAWGGDNAWGEATVPVGLSGVIAVAASLNRSVALKSDGTIRVWGYHAALAFPGGLTEVKAISAFGGQILALRNDGTVVSSSEGVIPDGLANITAVAAGGSHSLALRNNGTVVAWGYGADGQTTVPNGLNNVIAISAGGNHSLALKSDGTVVIWGANKNPESGEVTAQSMIPLPVSEVAAIAGQHWQFGPTVFLRNSGTVHVWGFDVSNQASVPAGLSGVTAIASGPYHTVALKSNGTVVAWGGYNEDWIAVPTGLNGVTAVTTEVYYTAALKSDGTVINWGVDYVGQSIVPFGLDNVTAISSGDYHTAALRANGTVVAWDSNDFEDHGQAQVPVGLNGVTAIAAGGNHTLALKSNGTVVAWGSNLYGESTVPNNLTGVTAVAARFGRSFALKNDGTLVHWGGSGLYDEFPVPNGLSGVTAIAAGGTWVKAQSRPVNTVSIANAVVDFDGLPHTLSIATANGRTATKSTYNGSYIPPSAVGTYVVFAEADYLDSYGSATGTLVIKPAIAPINDMIANASLLSGTKGMVNSATTNATAELGESAHAGFTAQRSLWWKWTVPFTGLVVINTAGSGVDTTLAMYTSTNAGGMPTVKQLKRFASNDNASSTNLAGIIAGVPVLGGTSFWISVDSKSAGPITLAYRVVAANDFFGRRLPMTGEAGTVIGHNANATKDSGELPTNVDGAGRTLWWSFTATRDGTLNIDTTGSTADAGGLLDTILFVTRVPLTTTTPIVPVPIPAVAMLRLLAQVDDAPIEMRQAETAVKVTAGNVYCIAIDVPAALLYKDGSYHLNWLLTPVSGTN